jgi:ATP-dependent Clp protease protease subunit
MPVKKKVKHELSYLDEVSWALSDIRRINLYNEIGSSSWGHVENSLAYMTHVDPKKPIQIMLNTPGGSVIDGFAIYDSIMHYKRKTPIVVHGMGAVMSMGVIIMQAATTRTCSPNAQFLLHEVSYGGNRQTITSHEDELILTSRLQKRLDDVIVQRTGMSLETLRSLIKRRDYAINAEEALVHKLIDKIIE